MYLLICEKAGFCVVLFHDTVLSPRCVPPCVIEYLQKQPFHALLEFYPTENGLGDTISNISQLNNYFVFVSSPYYGSRKGPFLIEIWAS